jgi:hypothetical protein
MPDNNRLTDVVKGKKISLTPEKLADFEGAELTLRNFQMMPGNFGNYVMMDVVDYDGVTHLLSTGGMTIMRILQELDPETDLPCQVKFVKMVSGTGRKVWSIE